MKTKILIPLIAAMLFSMPLCADDVDPAAKCEETYNSCVTKCDTASDGSETCYSDCDAAYEKCLTLAQENSENN